MKGRSALIVGGHPMLDDVVRQYDERSFSVTRASKVQFNGERPDELFVATEPVVGEKVAEDLRNVDYVRSVYEAQEEGRPMRCHLLLHSEEVMDMIVKGDLCDDMNGMAEFHFFTEAGELKEEQPDAPQPK